MAFGTGLGLAKKKGKIVHDAEYYILEAQNGKKWAAEDKELNKKLSELQKKYGRPPNIIHIMWDDTAYGDVGIPAAFYFLPSDPREKTPMLVNLIHLKSPFNRMKLRHDLWKKKYPDAKEVHGIPWTGIENPTPEVQALAKPKLDLKKLPFDPLEYVEHLDQIPFDPNMDPDLGK
jgi:hypothetical protein